MSRESRRALVRRGHRKASLSLQCRLLEINRSWLYYRPCQEREETLALMHRIDGLYLEHPFYGSRQMSRHLRREGMAAGRRRVRRLMGSMGLEAIYCKPCGSEPHPGHRIYPYLLRGLEMVRPHQVWCADITYIPMRRGYLYLVVVMDWASRCGLAWQLSNTLDSGFCVEALEAALGGYGKPEIFNRDQGTQFTSEAFTGRLLEAGVQVSMDGRGRWMDKLFIERLWRSLKYESVYLAEPEDGFEAERLIGEWLEFYNRKRPHSGLGGGTPEEAIQAA